MLFHLLDKYEFEEVHIFDINPELTLCYEMLKDSAGKVWNQLNSMINEYPSQGTDEQKEYYYSVRQAWNDGVPKLETMSKPNKVKRVAQTIFLNKTCFNGLFRVNSKGEFNVPIGSYKTLHSPQNKTCLKSKLHLKR